MDAELIAGDAGAVFDRVVLDSRQVRGGELFFALPGEHSDGHAFVADAERRGAAGAVVTDSALLPRRPGFALLEVEDSYQALHALTHAVRSALPLRLIAISGSAGKTTTKELLRAMLASRFRVAASPGNYNNLYGFPVAMLGVPDDTEWLVAEMAMSTPGELAQVSRLGRPDIAIITNVRPAHLEAFDTPERAASVVEIAEAKAELLEGLAADGRVIGNASDPEVVRIVRRHLERNPGVSVAWFSPATASVAAIASVAAAAPAAAVVSVAGIVSVPIRLLEAKRVETASTTSGWSLLIAESAGSPVRVSLPLHGAVNVENFLAAATCALGLGVSLEDIATAVSAIEPGRGRGRVLRLSSGVTVIDDCYNSNPSALEQALEAAAEVPCSRRWAVLGAMLELGASSGAFHRAAGDRAARHGFSPIVGVGEAARALVDAAALAGADAVWLADAEAAAQFAATAARAGDVVLVKGSRGVGLERVVERLAGSAD